MRLGSNSGLSSSKTSPSPRNYSSGTHDQSEEFLAQRSRAIGDIRALIRRRGRWKQDRRGSSGRAAAYRFRGSCLVQTPIETRIERRG